MISTELMAAVGCIAGLLACVFTYLSLAPDNRETGATITMLLFFGGITLYCMYEMLSFVQASSSPTRGEIGYFVIFTIGALGGTGTLLAFALHWFLQGRSTD